MKLAVCGFLVVCFPESHPWDVPIVTGSFIHNTELPICLLSGSPWWQCQPPLSRASVTLLRAYLNVIRSVHSCHFRSRSPLLPSFLFGWYIECLWAYYWRHHNQVLGCLPELSITMQWLVLVVVTWWHFFYLYLYCEVCIKDVSWSILHGQVSGCTLVTKLQTVFGGLELHK